METSKTTFGETYIKKMKEIGYTDCSEPTGKPRMWFENHFAENLKNKEYTEFVQQHGMDVEKYCAALAQLQTNTQNINACNNGPYDIKLFWNLTTEEYEAFLKCCPEKFHHLELISFYESFEIIRAIEEWQKTGAYSVRIEGMNRQYHIPLQEEFDEHDFGETNYLVGLYDGYPIATCRFYETEPGKVILGRLVVLPEFRNRQIGISMLRAAEEWINDLGYFEILIDSRLEAVHFYEKAGFRQTDSKITKSGNFDCIRMCKVVMNREINGKG